MTADTWLLVLNWNNAPDTLECLASLARRTDAAEVIVIDNGSTDNSVTCIRENFPDVTLLETGANLGYAGGNNCGIRYALERGAHFIGIVNNDVVVTPGFIAPLRDALKRESVGVTTALVATMDDREEIWALGQAVDWRTGNVSRVLAETRIPALVSREPFAVDLASGTVMMVTREVLERVGLLDDAFYLYYEETDWCMRVQQAGYKILAVPASVVWHKVSSTLGTKSPVVDYYMARNHLRLIARHWSGGARWRILAATVLEELRVIAAYTAKPWGGKRLPHRNARVLALRDAFLGRWGKMGADVVAVCYPKPA